jgi:cytidine deaminase
VIVEELVLPHEPGQPLDNSRTLELLQRARAAARNAYVPYSRFPVGAAVLTGDGSIYSGANIENASYGLTVCAERSAISAAVSDGHREVVAVAVSAPRVLRTTPCGACRQVLNEFRPAAEDMAVILDNGEDGEAIRLEELLPRSFGPRHLDRVESGDERPAVAAQPHAG